MAKIDLSGIEGYADMSAEDKLKALEAFELPEPDYTGYVKKDVFDKKASEAADYKKQLDANKSEDQKAKDEAEQKMQDLLDQVANLQKEKTISTYKASYMAQGYDEKLADATAKALAEGDVDKVFANQKAFLEAHDKNLKAQLLKNSPDMPGGNGEPSEGEDIKLAKELAKRKANGAKTFAENMKLYR